MGTVQAEKRNTLVQTSSLRFVLLCIRSSIFPSSFCNWTSLHSGVSFSVFKAVSSNLLTPLTPRRAALAR